MKSKFLIIGAGFAMSIAALSNGNAYAAPVGIASGQTAGTNWPMAEDIKKVCSTPDAPIHNVLSDGSLDNIMKIYSDKSTQYGIVQTDALVYQQGIDKRMMDRIVMVFPFFSTEIHLIAKDGSSIKSLADLAGKKVVEGPEGSGTWVTVQVIKSLTGVKWTPLNMSQKDGTNAVANGGVDAEFIVAGAPVSVIRDTKGIKLVPLNNPGLDKFELYTKTMIPSGMYPNIKGTVQTYKVDNVLATYAFKNQYQKEISDLVTCITRNVEKMQTSAGFHPKWKDVDPMDIDRIKWASHPAAVAAIKREAKRK
jgi:TRAP transporter TAXI family solute receptor